MFSSLKERFKEKLDNFRPQDALDKQIGDLVDRASSELLIGPDWGINLELVDVVNRDPNVCSEKALRALKRSLGKSNAKVQLLTLTILETCVKNCNPIFHYALATSDLWLDMLKHASDTSVTRIDGEVRDKILLMVETYSKALAPPQFREAYDVLLDQGVDFPVRTEEDEVPIITPPSAHQAAAAAAAAAGAAGHEAHQLSEAAFEGMSEEDRLAIQAAMAEMEVEERSAQEAAAVAAAAALAEQIQAQQRQQQQQQQQQQGAAAATGAQRPPQQQGPAAPSRASREPAVELPALPENIDDALQMVDNSTLLLNEMLASIHESDPSAVREPWILELVEQCLRMRSRLQKFINESTDEERLVSAAAQYENLSKVLATYDELVAKAESILLAARHAGVPPQAAPAPAVDHPPPSSLGYAPGAGSLRMHSMGSAGAQFTIIEEDEEEEAETALLMSKRQAPQVAAGAGGNCVGAGAGPARASNLIDLGDEAAAQAPLLSGSAHTYRSAHGTNHQANYKLASMLDKFDGQEEEQQQQQQGFTQGQGQLQELMSTLEKNSSQNANIAAIAANLRSYISHRDEYIRTHNGKYIRILGNRIEPLDVTSFDDKDLGFDSETTGLLLKVGSETEGNSLACKAAVHAPAAFGSAHHAVLQPPLEAVPLPPLPSSGARSPAAAATAVGGSAVAPLPVGSSNTATQGALGEADLLDQAPTPLRLSMKEGHEHAELL